VTREFPAHRILAHSNAGKIVFVEQSCFSLGISSINWRFSQIHRFLACLDSYDKLSLGGGKGYDILALTLPRDEAGIHHENVSRVRSSGVSISGPIYIHSAPQNVKVFVSVTRVLNHWIPSTMKVRQNMFSGMHVFFPCKLHILTELRICVKQGLGVSLL